MKPSFLSAAVLALAACGAPAKPQSPQQPIVAIQPGQPSAARPAGASEPVAAFELATTEMCACANNDSACGEVVVGKLSKSTADMANRKFSDDELRKIADISTRFSECVQRVMGNGAGMDPCGGGGPDPCSGEDD